MSFTHDELLSPAGRIKEAEDATVDGSQAASMKTATGRNRQIETINNHSIEELFRYIKETLPTSKFQLFRWLREVGQFDPRATNENGCTILHALILYGRQEWLECLVVAGLWKSLIDIPVGEHNVQYAGLTALELADKAEFPRKETMLSELRNCAQLHSSLNTRFTANGNDTDKSAAMKRLIDESSELQLDNLTMEHVFFWCAAWDNAEVYEYLLRKLIPQCCPGIQPYDGNEALFVANLRLATGQHRGAAPIVVAVKAGARGVIRTLLTWKSQVNCRDPVTRKTPLDIATDLCDNDIIEILRKSGAKLSTEMVNSDAAAQLSVSRKTPVYVRNQDSHP